MLTTRPQSYIEAKQTGVRLSNIIKGTTKDLNLKKRLIFFLYNSEFRDNINKGKKPINIIRIYLKIYSSLYEGKFSVNCRRIVDLVFNNFKDI